MSALKFNCPHCKESLEAPEELLGQLRDCPSCYRNFQIPASITPPPDDKLKSSQIFWAKPFESSIIAFVVIFLANLMSSATSSDPLGFNNRNSVNSNGELFFESIGGFALVGFIALVIAAVFALIMRIFKKWRFGDSLSRVYSASVIVGAALGFIGNLAMRNLVAR